MTDRRLTMSLDIGATVLESVVTSGFAAEVDSERAMLMAARLGTPERRFRRGFANMATVIAPPDQWEVLARWLVAQRLRHHVNPTAHDRSTLRAFTRLGLRIDHELTRLAGHPAYQGLPVRNAEAMVMPAWRVRGQGDPATWPVAPTPHRAIAAADWAMGDLEEGVLWPVVKMLPGGVVTTWVFTSADEPAPSSDEALSAG